MPGRLSVGDGDHSSNRDVGRSGASLEAGQFLGRLHHPQTPSHHVSRMLVKLGLRNRAEAAAYSARTGRGRDGPTQSF